MTKQYWLMDGRANWDFSKAMVLETCDTFKEANENFLDYGADTCLVEVDADSDIDEGIIIDSLSWLWCPECESHYVERLNDTNLRCEACGHHFARDAASVSEQGE